MRDHRGGELGQPAGARRAVGHLCLGRAAVNDGARKRGGHVGGTQADQVGVLAEDLNSRAGSRPGRERYLPRNR